MLVPAFLGGILDCVFDQEIMMSKQNRGREQQPRATSTGREGDKDRPRESGGSGRRTGGVMDGPASRVSPASCAGPTRELVARRAYENWEARGRPAGTDREDWFEAERELRVAVQASSPGDGPEKETIPAESDEHQPSDALPRRQPETGGDKGGRPVPTHESVAEQVREAGESEKARHAKSSNRDRMADIGRGNRQAGRQGQ
jgi:hypothetical protein